MSYFKRLRDLREDNDLKQDDIAYILDTTYQQISKYENGKQMMAITKYMKLARYYNVSLDYLTGMIDVKRPLDEKNTIVTRTLSEKERKLLQAYKNHPEHRESIDKLLDLKEIT